MSKNSDDSAKVSWWTNRWETFGKFMAIVTCFGAIVTISINLSPNGPDLVGHGWYTDFAVPPNLEAAHDSLKNRTDPHYLYDFITERVSTISQDSLPNIFDNHSFHRIFLNFQIRFELALGKTSSIHFRNIKALCSSQYETRETESHQMLFSISQLRESAALLIRTNPDM